MSRLDHLAPRDLERLSAYLDGHLTPQEAASLRARLDVDPELRLSLDEIRQVVSAVQDVGEVRVPRNFTLRAEVAAQRRERGFAVLRFATVLATALFVLTTAVRTVSAIPMQLGAAAPVAESATAAAQEMFANVAGAALPTNEVLQEALATSPAAAAAPLPAGTPTPAPTLGAAAVLSPAPTVAGCPSCPPSLTYRQEAPQDLEEKTTEATGEAEAPVPEIPSGSIGGLVVLQWALAVAAVVLGILMVRARRRR